MPTWYVPQLWHVQQQLSPSTCFLTFPWPQGRLQTESGCDGFSNWNCNSVKNGNGNKVMEKKGFKNQKLCNIWFFPWPQGRLQTESGCDGFSNWNCNSVKIGNGSKITNKT